MCESFFCNVCFGTKNQVAHRRLKHQFDGFILLFGFRKTIHNFLVINFNLGEFRFISFITVRSLKVRVNARLFYIISCLVKTNTGTYFTKIKIKITLKCKKLTMIQGSKIICIYLP